MNKDSHEATKKDPAQFIGGFVRDRGQNRGVRVAHSKIDELPTIDGDEASERANNPMIRHAALSKRRTKLACLGIPSQILDAGDPGYSRTVRLANAYKKSRTKELFVAHGHVSSGVSALLAASSLALAGSRFLYEIASSAEFAPEKGLGLPQLLKLASSLSDSARQNELSAWELCAREAVVRKRNTDSAVQTPWMVQDASGQTKRRPGRPRKVENALEAVNQVPEETNSVVQDVEDNQDA